jgi:antitoxin component YwqK of YwqJK toxin-antitoxin module
MIEASYMDGEKHGITKEWFSTGEPKYHRWYYHDKEIDAPANKLAEVVLFGKVEWSL